MFIAQMFSRLSVRARIIVLGIIPVIGFLATGIAFVTGDTQVGSAFDSVHRSTRHKSGVAMRFPRVHRIRWDKPFSEADRLENLERLVT